MAQGSSSPKAWDTLDELRATILGLQRPKGAQQTGYDQMRYEEILVQLHELGNARRERLLAAEQGLPAIMWECEHLEPHTFHRRYDECLQDAGPSLHEWHPS